MPIWRFAGYGQLQRRASQAWATPGQQPGSSAGHAWALLAGRPRHGHLKRPCPPPARCLKALKAPIRKFTAARASRHYHNTVAVGLGCLYPRAGLDPRPPIAGPLRLCQHRVWFHGLHGHQSIDTRVLVTFGWPCFVQETNGISVWGGLCLWASKVLG